MNEKEIYDWYVAHGMSPAGAAGITANIGNESNYNSKNLQNSCEKRLGYTDEEYTAAVDSGAYKRFGKDSAGYGFCQWTSGGRKAGLLAYAKQKGVSIGNPVMQLEYSLKEMSASLKKDLQSADDPYKAAVAFMLRFERPANQSAANQAVRGNRGKEVYERCYEKEEEGKAMATKTGEGLAAYAKSKLGTPYFYGSKMSKLTEDFMQRMHKQYPKTVTENYMKKARNQDMVGKICCDCSGLIGKYRETQLGSSQLYARAKKRLPIKDLKDFAVGVVLWHQGHVAVFAGYENGVPYCIEERGIDYGCVKSKVTGRGFKYGLTFDDMDYTYSNKVEGTSKGKNPYKKPTDGMKKGAKGEAVKWLQWELVEAGYKLDIDGEFGSKTEAAVKAYQASAKLDIKWPGTVGSKTITSLAAN